MLTYKEKIIRNFSCAALNYDREAVIQNKMGRLLFKQLISEKPKADSILDLGSGTGYLLEKVSRVYPGAKLYGLDIAHGMIETAAKRFQNKRNVFIIEGDIENLPLGENSFDLVISNATLQWIKDLDTTLKDINRVLKKNGVFYANIFGEKTFQELKLSLKSIGLVYPFSFISRENLAEILTKNGFKAEIKTKIFYKYYPDLMTFLKKVKEIGAGNIFPVKNNLGQRSLLLDLGKEYAGKFAGKKGLKVTYEITMFKAKKAGYC
ncbi:MAG: malonyl-ACP O-methyltransferase BioC [bacterium]